MAQAARAIIAVFVTYFLTIPTSTNGRPDPEFLIADKLEVIVYAGTTAVLPCKIENLGERQVAWTDPQSRVLTIQDSRVTSDMRMSLERPYIKDWNLHIRNVSQTDNGKYYCNMQTDPMRSRAVYLRVIEWPDLQPLLEQQPLLEFNYPSQTRDNGSTLVLQKGGTLYLSCIDNGSVQWVVQQGNELSGPGFNSSLIPDTKVTYQTGQKDLYVAHLRIDNIQYDYTGLYICRRTGNSSRNASVYVFVEDPNEPFVDHHYVALTFPSYAPLALTPGKENIFPCRTSSSEYQVELKRFNEHTDSSETIDRDGGVAFDPKKGVIVNMVDEHKHVGVFTCEVKTTVKGIFKTFARTWKTVIARPDPEFLTADKLDVIVDVGNTAILPCRVENLGDRQVAWTDKWSTLLTLRDRRIIDDMRMSIERPYIEDWNLYIRDVNTADSGEYVCQMNTNPVQTRTVYLRVVDDTTTQQITTSATTSTQNPSVHDVVTTQENGLKPFIDDTVASEISVRVGDTAILPCRVFNLGNSTVTWRKGSYTVPLTVGRSIFIRSGRLGIEGSDTEWNLRIQDVQAGEHGIYECSIVTGNTKVMQRAVRLRVIDNEMEPQFGKYKVSEVNVRAGDTAILPCRQGVASVIWKKGNNEAPLTIGRNSFTSDKRISSDVSDKGWSLLIENVRPSDADAYVCLFQQKGGVQQEVVHLNIIDNTPSHEAPVIFKSSRDEQTFEEGDIVKLLCNASGVPPPNITWYRRTRHGPQVTTREEIHVGSPGEFLEIYNISREDDGDYECVADNGVEPTDAKIMKVTVTFLPKLELPTTRISQYIGGETILECRISAKPFGYIMGWKKDGLEIMDGGKYHRKVYIEDANTKLLSLKIVDLEMEDFGTYTCFALNGLGLYEQDMMLLQAFDDDTTTQVTAASSYGSTSIQTSSTVGTDTTTATNDSVNKKENEFDPVIDKNGVHEIKVRVGDTAILPCRVFDVEAGMQVIENLHQIAWIKGNDDQPLTIGSIRFIGDERLEVEVNKNEMNLRIEDVRSTDADVYTCFFDTKGGAKKRVVKLNILEAPVILKYSRDQLFVEGDIAILKCEASGGPPPNITWYKKTRHGHHATRKVIGTGGEIEIFNISRADDGDYECVADNGVEPTDSKIMRVTVLFPPKIQLLTTRISQYIGRETFFDCEVSANPLLYVGWKKGNIEIKNGGKYRIEVYEQDANITWISLRILDLEVADFGTYTCYAINGFGTDQQEIVLVQAFVDTTTTKVATPSTITYGTTSIKTYSVATDTTTATNTLAKRKDYPARIVDYSNEATVRVGGYVVLWCIAEGSPKPTVTWNKTEGSREWNDRVKDTNGITLTIPDVSPSDAGEYECVASNGGGQTDRRYVTLNVEYPPKAEIISVEKGNGDSKSGNGDSKSGNGNVPDLSIACRITGNPIEYYAWSLNGERIQDDDNFKISECKTGDFNLTYTITIMDKSKLRGMLKCEAINKYGVASTMLEFKEHQPTQQPTTSRPPTTTVTTTVTTSSTTKTTTSVEILGSGDAEQSESMTVEGTDQVSPGEEIYLVCTGSRPGSGIVEVDWFLDGDKIDDSKTKWLDRVSIFTAPDSDGVVISEIEIWDTSVHDTGTYLCRSSELETGSLYVDVSNGPQITQQQPTTTATVTTSSTKPMPTSTQILSSGGAEQSGKMSVEGTVLVRPGEEILIFCTGSRPGRGIVEVDWFLDGDKIDDSKPKWLDRISIFTAPDSDGIVVSEIEIWHATVHDTGMYMCRSSELETGSLYVDVSNAAEQPEMTTTSIPVETTTPVTVKPENKGLKSEPSVEQSWEHVSVVEGYMAILPCSVYNRGDHKVVWVDSKGLLLTLNERRILDDPRLSVERYSENEWNLHIRNVSTSDTGNYSCQINTYPIKMKVISLYVQGSLSIDGTETVVEGDEISLTCIGRNTWPITVEWYFDGNMIDYTEYRWLYRVSLSAMENYGIVKYKLTIDKSRVEDSGLYECRKSDREVATLHVMVSKGTTTVTTIKLNDTTTEMVVNGSSVTDIPGSMTIEGTETVVQGGEITLYCSGVRPGSGPIEVDWFLDGNKIDVFQDRWWRRVTISGGRKDDGTVFSNITIRRSELKDTGVYVCRSSDLEVASFQVIVSEETPTTLKTPTTTMNFETTTTTAIDVDDSGNEDASLLGEVPWLYYANRKDIRKLRTDSRYQEVVLNATDNSIALDIDIELGLMFYTDSNAEVIKSLTITHPDSEIYSHGNPTVVVSKMEKTAFAAEGIAVDWLYKHIYWTDTGSNKIKVSTYQGQHIKTLINSGLDEPRGIALDPENGYMYWTDWGKEAKIERCGMDGKNREVIVSKGEGLKWPNGLTIDYVDKRIYWVDSKLHMIGTSKLDGTDYYHVPVDAAEIQRPFSIDVFEDSLYWTDWFTNSIRSVNKISGGNPTTLSLGSYSVMGIKVYHAMKQDRAFAATAKTLCDNAQCEQLCLPEAYLNTNASQTVSCSCSDGFTLNPDTKTCTKSAVVPTTFKTPSETPTTLKTPTTTTNFETTTTVIGVIDSGNEDASLWGQLKIEGEPNVSEGEQIRLICSVGYRVDLDWFFQGLKINPYQSHWWERTTTATRHEGSTTISEFVINNSRKNDSGTYTCRSSALHVSSFRVNVTDVSKTTTKRYETTPIMDSVEDVKADTRGRMLIIGKSRVSVGKQNRLACSVECQVELDWFFERVKIYPSQPSWSERTTITTRREDDKTISVLVINNSRMNDTGYYICRSSDREARSFRVNVTDPPTTSLPTTAPVPVTTYPPKHHGDELGYPEPVFSDDSTLQIYPGRTTVMDGSVFYFTCKMEGASKVTFRWERNGRPIDARRRRYTVHPIIDGSVVKISPVKYKKDNGKPFTCIASAGPWESRVDARLHVIPRQDPLFRMNTPGFPLITVHPSLSSIEKGRTTALPCEAESSILDQTPRIRWMKNMEEVHYDERTFMDDAGNLVIKDADSFHEGQYVCVAENSIGTTFSNLANVYVKERRVPPQFVEILSPKFRAIYGSRAKLDCRAEGSPTPLVSWTKDYHERKKYRDGTPSGSVLKLENVTEPERYTCVAENMLDRIIQWVDIEIVYLDNDEDDEEEDTVDGDINDGDDVFVDDDDV